MCKLAPILNWSRNLAFYFPFGRKGTDLEFDTENGLVCRRKPLFSSGTLLGRQDLVERLHKMIFFCVPLGNIQLRS